MSKDQRGTDKRNYGPREIGWSEFRNRRDTPYLQKVNLLIAVRFLAVADPSAGGCQLDVAALENFRISH